MRQIKKILLIDDEKAFTSIMEKAFIPYTQEVRLFTANRADLGLEIALRENPDIILSDLRMPGLSGEEALRRLKQQLPNAKLMVVTAWDDGRNKDRIIKEIGVHEYFEKPIQLRNFLEKVLGYLGVSVKTKGA